MSTEMTAVDSRRQHQHQHPQHHVPYSDRRPYSDNDDDHVVDVRIEDGNSDDDIRFEESADGDGGSAAVIMRTTDDKTGATHNTHDLMEYYNGKARQIVLNNKGYMLVSLTSLLMVILIVVSVTTSERREQRAAARHRVHAPNPDQPIPPSNGGSNDDNMGLEKWGVSLDIPNIPSINLTIVHNAWSPMGSDLMGPDVSGVWKYDTNNFGHHVALSGDGRRIAVAVSIGKNVDTTVNQPSTLEELLEVTPSSPISTVYVYNFDETLQTWVHDATISPPEEWINSNPPSMEELANGYTHEGVTMSKDGNRIAFTVSDKVLVYFKLGQLHQSEWKTYGPPIDPYGTGSALTSSSPVQNDHYTTLAFSVGGDFLLVRGTLADDATKSVIRTYACTINPGDGYGSGPSVSWDAIPGQELIVPSPRGGLSISDDGMRLAVGMPEENGPNAGDTENGKVQVFERQQDGSNTWVQVGQDIVGNDAYDRVGETLMLSGNGQRLAVGTPAGNYIQTYELSTGTTMSRPQWVTVGQRLELDSADWNFGHSVDFSLDGTILAVGAPGTPGIHLDASNAEEAKDMAEYRYGSVYVYRYNDVNNQWLLLLGDSKKIASGIPDDNFGSTVSLNTRGDRLAVGAPYRQIGDNLVTGVAAVYQWND